MAAEHSLMSREHHFEDVMRGTTAGMVDNAEGLATTPDESAVECSAKCGAAGSRIRRRGAAGKDRTRGDHWGYRGFNRFLGGFSGVTPSRTLGSPSLKRPWMAFQA